jgi:hypothetical protein
MICSASLKSFGSETDGESGDRPEDGDVDFYLELPLFEDFMIGDELHFKTSAQGLETVAKIYNAYITIGEDYLDQSEEMALLVRELKLLESTKLDCISTLAHSESDREFVYRLRESDLKKSEAAIKKQKRRFIFIGTGVGVAALCVGVLVGMFAF